MKISVILPTYNEIDNIVSLVNSVLENISTQYEKEIIVVDDNSPDGTYQIIKEAFNGDSRVRCVLRTKDRSLSKSIRNGIELATGDKIIIMNTDFTHDPVEIPKLLHVSIFYDIVIGSRFCPGGRMQNKIHYIASFIYNLLIRLILRTQIQDNLGGYFCISNDNMNKLDFNKIFYGYGDYFIRLLYFAQRKKMTVVEIPAIYNARSKGQSKSNYVKMLFTYTISAFKLKFSRN
jgi:dolichol-phosphate mannosyltransferase